jgi:phospholipase/carboxylesterase
MSKIVNGSSLQPLSGGKPGQIVVLLHGYGSNGSDLISLAPHWQSILPNALFLAPNAPQRCPTGSGFQWWGLTSFTSQALAEGAASATPAIDAFVDRKLDQYGLTEADLAIIGFSQGTMMALHIGLRRKRQVAAIVGYSGMLTDSANLANEIRSKPPVLLVHGTADNVVPFSALHAATTELEPVGVQVTAHSCPGLGHGVDAVGIELGGNFVKKAFGATQTSAKNGSIV